MLTTLIRLGAVIGGEWIEKAGINGAAVNPDDVVAYFGGSLDDAIAGLASIIFRMDGSGHLAKGNISWDDLGNIIVNGKYQSAENGTRFVIDPDDSRLKMFDSNNNKIAEIGFVNGFSFINLIQYDINGDVSNVTSINPSLINTSGVLSMSNVPSSGTGLPLGTVWRDGNTLKIVI